MGVWLCSKHGCLNEVKCWEDAKRISIKLHQTICSTERTGKSAWATFTQYLLWMLPPEKCSNLFPKTQQWCTSMQEECLRNASDIDFMKKQPLDIATCESKDYCKGQLLLSPVSSYFPWQSHRVQFHNILQDAIRSDGERQWISMPSING